MADPTCVFCGRAADDGCNTALVLMGGGWKCEGRCPCPECGGEGEVCTGQDSVGGYVYDRCDKCNGTGAVEPLLQPCIHVGACGDLWKHNRCADCPWKDGAGMDSSRGGER